MNTHGGHRPGSGRKKKQGWALKGLRLELVTSEMLAEAAHRAHTSQSKIANSLLVKQLRILLKKFKTDEG